MIRSGPHGQEEDRGHRSGVVRAGCGEREVGARRAAGRGPRRSWTETTAAALRKCLPAVRPGGLVSVMAYVGHAGGRREYEAASEVLAALPASEWASSELSLLNRADAPRLLLGYRT